MTAFAAAFGGGFPQVGGGRRVRPWELEGERAGKAGQQHIGNI